MSNPPLILDERCGKRPRLWRQDLFLINDSLGTELTRLEIEGFRVVHVVTTGAPASVGMQMGCAPPVIPALLVFSCRELAAGEDWEEECTRLHPRERHTRSFLPNNREHKWNPDKPAPD